MTVMLCFQNKYLDRAINQNLQTDANGKISLGKLEEVISVNAILQATGDIQRKNKSWILNSHKTINYPHALRVCEGDQIVLPLLHNELNRHKISFVETVSSGSVIENRLRDLKVDKTDWSSLA